MRAHACVSHECVACCVTTGRIFFLEINPNCGIFYPEGAYGSADVILSLDPQVGLVTLTMLTPHVREGHTTPNDRCDRVTLHMLHRMCKRVTLNTLAVLLVPCCCGLWEAPR